jgi:hypothetical protein
MKNVGKRFKKAAMAAALASVALGSMAPAHAYESDPWFHKWEATSYTMFVQQVTNQFFAINTYLSQIYLYMNSGVGETGTGVIGTMQKLARQNQEFSESANKNLAQMNRVTQADGSVAQRVATAMPDPRECSEIPRVMGARMAGGGGGGGRSVKGSIERVVSNAGGGTAPSAIAQAGEVYATRSQAKYCSTADVTFSNGKKHAAFGCQAASTSMPAADLRVQSLFVPAHNFEDPAKASAANITFSAPEEAQAAADAAKMLISSFSPPGISPDMEATPAGKQYLTRVATFNARLSPAIHALSQIASLRMPDKNLAKEIADNWVASATPVYSRIFPGMAVPEKPSEAEVMRYEVLRRYADYGAESWHQKQIADNDPARLTRELTDAVVLNTYVTWQTHNRLEESNAIQGASLAQAINPTTKQELEAAARSVYSNKQ